MNFTGNCVVDVVCQPTNQEKPKMTANVAQGHQLSFPSIQRLLLVICSNHCRLSRLQGIISYLLIKSLHGGKLIRTQRLIDSPRLFHIKQFLRSLF